MINAHIPGVSLLYTTFQRMSLYGQMDAFRSSTSRRFYSSLNVVGVMLRTGSEGGCYKHIPLDKPGEDNQRIQLKRMLIKEPVPTVNDCSTLFSADMLQAKDGELLIVQFISRG